MMVTFSHVVGKLIVAVKLVVISGKSVSYEHIIFIVIACPHPRKVTAVNKRLCYSSDILFIVFCGVLCLYCFSKVE